MSDNAPVKSDSWVKFNSFLLGIIAVFVVMNYTENLDQRQKNSKEVVEAQETRPKKSKKKVVKDTDGEIIDSASSYVHPNCTSLLPYWSGRWGCTVRPL